MEVITLYRPVGPKELDLIAASGYREFPPRLPEQPIFYPVMNQEYATQIARDWNVKESGSGYVTRFAVKADFAQRYAVQTVGTSVHKELWVPAEELAEFNRNIVGLIEVIAQFPKPWLAYSGQSVDELIAMEAKYRIDSLVVAFDTALRQKAETMKLNDVEIVIVAVEALEHEENSGGYSQFFFNAREFVPVIVSALEKINCPVNASIAQSAIDTLGIEGEITMESVQSALEDNDTSHKSIKYSLNYEAESIENRLFEYIKANKDSIQFIS